MNNINSIKEYIKLLENKDIENYFGDLELIDLTYNPHLKKFVFNLNSSKGLINSDIKEFSTLYRQWSKRLITREDMENYLKTLDKHSLIVFQTIMSKELKSYIRTKTIKKRFPNLLPLSKTKGVKYQLIAHFGYYWVYGKIPKNIINSIKAYIKEPSYKIEFTDQMVVSKVYYKMIETDPEIEAGKLNHRL